MPLQGLVAHCHARRVASYTTQDEGLLALLEIAQLLGQAVWLCNLPKVKKKSKRKVDAKDINIISTFINIWPILHFISLLLLLFLERIRNE